MPQHLPFSSHRLLGFSLSQATICLALRERLLELVALRVRVDNAVRLRVHVLVDDALAVR